MTRRLLAFITVAAASLIFTGMHAVAADLPAADSRIIETAGVPLYAGTTFVNGSQDVGYRFATAIAPEEVRAWYKEQLPVWSLYSEYDGWILYEGAPGAGMGELMSKKQVQVQTNEKLSEWFGMDKALSTEIVIMIPRQ
jgi:hypothetical protein